MQCHLFPDGRRWQLSQCSGNAARWAPQHWLHCDSNGAVLYGNRFSAGRRATKQGSSESLLWETVNLPVPIIMMVTLTELET